MIHIVISWTALTKSTLIGIRFCVTIRMGHTVALGRFVTDSEQSIRN